MPTNKQKWAMDAEILGHREEDIGVEIYDERDIEHVIHVGYDGKIIKHYVEDYPAKPEDRTQEEQRIMTQVEERAKLAAQQEFPDADILTAEWQPEELGRAMYALEKMHVDDFAEEFEECYQMLTKPHSVPDVPEGMADILHQPFLINEDDEVAYVPTPVLQYVDENGEHQLTHRESQYTELVEEPHLTQFTIMLPPLKFKHGAYEFPDGFQVFIIEHLMGQVRDVYINMGEEPPEPFSETDAYGKPITTEDEEYYEDWGEE